MFILDFNLSISGRDFRFSIECQKNVVLVSKRIVAVESDTCSGRKMYIPFYWDIFNHLKSSSKIVVTNPK